jgi:hypothetical protein
LDTTNINLQSEIFGGGDLSDYSEENSIKHHGHFCWNAGLYLGTLRRQ